MVDKESMKYNRPKIATLFQKMISEALCLNFPKRQVFGNYLQA